MATKALTTEPSVLLRLARSPGMPLVIATVLIPLLVFGFLRGGLFIAHAHGDSTTHLHAISPVSATKLIAGERCAEVRHDHSHERCPSSDSNRSDQPHDDGSDCNHAPEGVLVSLAQPKQLPTRAVDVTKALHQLTFTIVVAILPTVQVQPVLLDPPDAITLGKPRDFVSLGAGERLVRTSRALLI